jgi:hypothetical protein
MSTQMTYGSQPILTATVRDEDGDLADPTTIQLRVRLPKDGLLAATTVTVAPDSHPSLGVYRFRFPVLDRTGRWGWRVEATEGIIGAQEGALDVPATIFA